MHHNLLPSLAPLVVVALMCVPAVWFLVQQARSLKTASPVHHGFIYLAILAVTASGMFVAYVSAFVLVLAPLLLVFLACAFLALYLPLLDWPWLAWRHSRNAWVTAGAFALALVPALAPLLVNDELADRAGRDWFGRLFADETIPVVPFAARDILVVTNMTQTCNDYCRLLLWSGATDHVLVTPRIDGDLLPSAMVYTLQPARECEPNVDQREPREGRCLTMRDVSDPHFDAIIQMSGHEDSKLTLFALQGGAKAQRHDITGYDCRSGTCRKVLMVHAASYKRLAFPAYPSFAFGIDNGGPFGLRYAMRPTERYAPQEVLRAAFGLDVTGDHPGTPFAGTIATGSPLLPTARYFRDLRERETQARVRAEETRTQAALDKVAAGEARRKAYAQELADIRAAHPDCPSAIISVGPEPRFTGCDRSGNPATVPGNFADLQAKLRGR